MGRKLVDFSGRRFGRLVVGMYLGRKNHSSAWECLCDCGATVTATSTALRTGNLKSCGCYRRERMAALNLVHGARGGAARAVKPSEYKAWESMRSRCLNEADPGYSRYGGRGITVCERWQDSYEAFLEDMGPKPSARHSLDRIDFDGNYSPENCRWATWHEQARNRSNNRLVEYCGQVMPMVEAAESAGIPYKTVKSRLGHGWSIDDALARPVRKQGGRRPS